MPLRSNASPLRQTQLKVCAQKIMGRDKYLGGDVDPTTGIIYCVPGSARRVLKIDPSATPDAQLSFLGESDLMGKFKWLRSCTSQKTGAIYGLPSCSDQILKIDLRTERISTFGALGPLKWKWHGGVTSRVNGKIYAIPCNHSQTLRLDPEQDDITFIGIPDEQPQKWYGGVEAPNGYIYGIPNCASQVLCIDPHTDEVTTFGQLSNAPYKWHGAALGHDGCIYGIPSHTDRVLRIDTANNQASLMGDRIAPGAYRPQGKYKYGGAVVGSQGAIYCFPSDADRVLKIEPDTERVYAIGPAFQHHNKWQNGYLAPDNCIYAIPCNMDSVLKIDCATDQVSTLPLPAQIQPGFEKWEGGVVDTKGNLWCMPQHSKHVLSIQPPKNEVLRASVAPVTV